MSKVKILDYVILVLFFLFFTSWLFSMMGNSYSPSDLDVSAPGEPLVIRRKSTVLATEIHQVMADEKHIYVVHGYNSAVQVYSLDGLYEYTIAVYNYNNGMTEIALSDGRLFILDKNNGLYIFESEEMVEYMNGKQSKDYVKCLTFGKNSAQYRIKGCSVWRISQDKEECVIKRPGYLLLFQAKTLLIGFACGLILFFIGLFRKKME